MNKNEDSAQGRYIQLTGGRIHQPYWRTLLESGSVLTYALVALGTTAIKQEFFRSTALDFIVPGMAIMSGFLLAARKTLSNYIINSQFSHSTSPYCIDTKPEGITPPTSPQNIARALYLHSFFNRASNMNLVMTGATYAFTSLIAVSFSGLSDPLRSFYEAGNLTTIMWAPQIAEAFSHRQRFAKVLSGKSVIVDTPAIKIQEPARAQLAISMP